MIELNRSNTLMEFECVYFIQSLIGHRQSEKLREGSEEERVKRKWLEKAFEPTQFNQARFITYSQTKNKLQTCE